MKKILSSILFLIISIAAFAQVSPNDLIIQGYVSNAQTSFAVSNWPVTISGMGMTETVYTNANGFYSDTISDGSVTGPNQLFIVQTMDCDSSLIADTVSNNQGTIDVANVDFQICAENSNPSPCNAQFSQTGPLLADSSYQFIGVANDSSAYHLWTFGDGSSSTLEMPFHSYEVNSSYSVCHIVGINEACADTVCSVFNYFGTEPQCDAVFNVIDNGNGTFTVSPLSLPTPAAGISWTINGFGANGLGLVGYPYTFNYPSPNNPGSICMTYYNVETGCVATYCDTIVNTCSAEFTYTFWNNDNFYTWPLNPHVEGNSYSYTVESSVYGILADNETSSNPGFTIPLDAGTVSICLNLTNEFSLCNATFCDTMSVSPDTSCTADIVAGYGSNGWPEFTVNGGAEIASYNWNIATYDSNGTAMEFFSSMQSNASIPAGTAYASIEVVLAIIFETGCQWGGSLIHTGQPDSSITCDASIQYSYVGDVPNPSMFPYQFYSAYPGDTAAVIHSWVTSDAQTSSSYSPLFGFAPGTYTVCHSVSDVNGLCSDSTCISLTVVPDTLNGCTAMFTSYISNTATNEVAFGNMSSDLNASFIWQFADGTYSNEVAPLHSFDTTGVYQVCLDMSTGSCSDSYCLQVYVGVPDTIGGLYLGGVISVGSNVIDIGSVKLYSLDTLSSSVELIGQYPMNNMGSYIFTNLSEGIYLVRAGLSDSSSYYNDYVPTYFGSQYYWFDAEPIYLTQSGDFYNISLIYGSNPGGNGYVGGSIDDGPFRLSNPELSSLMSPVLGAQVIITDLAGVPQRWVRTDNSGAFAIPDLAYGTYRLMADEPGMTCLPIEFTLSEQTPGVTIDLVMGDEISGIVSYETSAIQADIYPNPSNSLANLNIELMKPASLTMTMTSITGQVTWTQTNSFLQGKSSIQIPVRGIADGLYFLSIYSDKGQLITSRKMQVAN